MMRSGRSLLAVLVVGIALWPVAPAAAKSYRFSHVSVRIDLRADGSFHVHERRTFRFDGPFRFAFVTIPKGIVPGAPRPYSIHATEVAEIVGPEPVPEPGVGEMRQPFVRARFTSDEPGTFVLEQSQDDWTIRWFYSAADEERTFAIDYDIRGAVTRFDDVAELNWKFVGDGWDVASESVRARVELPSQAPHGSVRVWGHGPLEGEVDLIESATGVDGGVWEVDRLPPHTFVEGRMAFPPDLVPGAPLVRRDRLPGVLALEERLAAQANRARFLARFWNIAAPVAGLLSLAFFVFLFVRFGMEPEVPDPGRYLREPPVEHPPAIVGYLMRFGKVKPVDMVATLMDLARRGYLKIGETREEEGFFRRRLVYDHFISVERDDGPDLTPYEREVITLIRSARGDEGVGAEELKDWAKANPAQMRARFQEFRSQVASHARSLGLIEPRTVIMAASLGAVLVAGLVIAAALSAQADRSSPISIIRNAPGALVGAVFVAAQVALTPLLRRRTFKGAVQFKAWRAFRRFLEDFSLIREHRPTAVVLWEKYLVYAVPLGVAQQVAAAIQLHAPEVVAQNGFAWLAMSGDGDATAFGSSISSFTESFTASAEAAFATAPSSGGGGGGGFSGGSSGGGGGGGGGAG